MMNDAERRVKLVSEMNGTMANIRSAKERDIKADLASKSKAAITDLNNAKSEKGTAFRELRKLEEQLEEQQTRLNKLLPAPEALAPAVSRPAPANPSPYPGRGLHVDPDIALGVGTAGGQGWPRPVRLVASVGTSRASVPSALATSRPVASSSPPRARRASHANMVATPARSATHVRARLAWPLRIWAAKYYWNGGARGRLFVPGVAAMDIESRTMKVLLAVGVIWLLFLGIAPFLFPLASDDEHGARPEAADGGLARDAGIEVDP
jgi:hypothetical protein